MLNFFNFLSKKPSPSPSLSQANMAQFTCTNAAAAAAARMNLKPHLCICHSRRDQVYDAHLRQIVFFSQNDRPFRYFPVGLAAYHPLYAMSFPWRGGPCVPPVHMLTDIRLRRAQVTERTARCASAPWDISRTSYADTRRKQVVPGSSPEVEGLVLQAEFATHPR